MPMSFRPLTVIIKGLLCFVSFQFVSWDEPQQLLHYYGLKTLLNWKHWKVPHQTHFKVFFFFLPCTSVVQNNLKKWSQENSIFNPSFKIFWFSLQLKLCCLFFSLCVACEVCCQNVACDFLEHTLLHSQRLKQKKTIEFCSSFSVLRLWDNRSLNCIHGYHCWPPASTVQRHYPVIEILYFSSDKYLKKKTFSTQNKNTFLIII